jgi:hypothetical protein
MNRLILSIALVVMMGSMAYLMAQSQAPIEYAPNRVPGDQGQTVYDNRVSGDAAPNYQKPAPGGQANCGPQYPYSPYHNPYYTGGSGREVFTDAADWITKLPFSIMDRLTNLWDNRRFPRIPATHGGARLQPVNGGGGSEGNPAGAASESAPRPTQ